MVKYWGQYHAAVAAAPRVRPGGSITLFSAWLARKPTADETTKMKEFLAKHQDPRAAYGDVLWVLLNSSEFALNR